MDEIVWPTIISAGASLAASAISGDEASKQRRRDEAENEAQRELTQLGMYAGGPREEVLPYIDQNLAATSALFGERDEYYGTAGNTAGLQAAVTEGLYGEQVGRGNIDSFLQNSQNAAVTGKYNVDPNAISNTARSLLNSDLIDSQVDAFGRDIGRTLGENTITGIRSADIATGNFGSSRGGVQEAIARRSAEDRIADFRGALTGQALQSAQQIETGNVNTNLGLLRDQFNVGQVQAESDRNRVQDLAQIGTIERQLEQARLDNLTGASDFDLQNKLQYSDFLTGQANIGNLVKDPTK